MKNAILREKVDAGNPNIRLDDGGVAPVKPRRGQLRSMAKHLLRRIFFYALPFFPLTLTASELMCLEKDGLPSHKLADLYAASQQKSVVANATASKATSKKGYLARKLVIANPDTQTNLVLTLDSSASDVKITGFLVAELSNSGLGVSTNYDCFIVDEDVDGDLSVIESSHVIVTNKVKLPSFRYGSRGKLHIASPTERRLKSVSIEVPIPIFVEDITEEERARVLDEFRKMAIEEGAYRYEYILPNGDLSTHSDISGNGETVAIDNLTTADNSTTTVGNFCMVDWSDSSTTAATSTQIAPINAGAQTWDGVLSISQPVYVKVGFASLGASIVGSSYSPQTYTKDGVQYPAALIDQIMGADMHPSSGYDIRIRYNKNFSFYYGTDGNCPSTKIDLMSTVTHELCHGLGFSSYHYRGSDGESPDGSWNNGVPSIFDVYLYYGSGRLPNLTQAVRKTAFTSEALYWDGTNAKAANGGSRIKMYAPSTYDGGSSVSHWDDSVTFTTFMKYSASFGEVCHAVDTRLIGAFKDMGWPLYGDVDPPANDDFASAITISGTSGSTSGSNVGATSQSGEPLLTSYSSATTTVWWKWTAAEGGVATINTIGSSFDTQMGIYTGSSLSSLSLVTKDDDSGTSQTSVCTFNCTAGTTYYICVGGYSGKTGTIKLNWSVVTLSSISISGASSVASGDKETYTCTAIYSDGTTSTVSPSWDIPSGDSYASITSAGVLTALAVTDSKSATVKATYSSGGTLKSAIRSVTITPDTSAEYIDIDAKPGTLDGMTDNINNTTSQCWYFDLTSWPSWVRSFSHVMSRVLTVTSFSATADASVTWSGNAFFQVHVTENTTSEERLWMVVAKSSSGAVLKKFLFRQAAGGVTTISYTITYNPGSHGSGSQQTATKTQGVALTLKGAVFTRSGYTQTGWATSDGGSLAYTLGDAYTTDAAVTLYPYWTQTALSNDGFFSATTVSGTSGSTTGSNVGATSQSGEPLVSYVSSATTTVWWKWTATSSGTVQFDTIGTSFDTVMGVYTGTSVTALTMVAQDDDSGGSRTSKCTFDCSSGTTYYICVGGYGAATGTIILNWSVESAATIYTVTYKPGSYGSGSQQTATKAQGVALTLKGAIFTRSGYTQTGWATSDGGSLAYALGGAYTTDASVTLYPVWTQEGDEVPDGEPRTETVDGIEWVFSVSNGVAVIGDNGSSLEDYSGELIIPDVLGGCAVTYLGDRAFVGCSGITGVTIPLSVTSIGWNTFCSCSGLESVSFPPSVVRIGWNAFCWCSKLQCVTIPPSVTSIDRNAFYDCPITTIYVAVGDADRVRNLMDDSGFDCSEVTFREIVATYAVTYAPGSYGSGTQQTATKTQNVALTLKGAIFTRTGYTQTGWATSDGGSLAYALGGSYTANAAITLYPVWTANVVKPTAPVVSSVSTSYTSYAKVTWGAVSGATSYSVYRSTSTTRSSSAYASSITTSYYYDYNATPGVTYYYWVEAVNSAGSAISSYASGYRAVSLSLGSTAQNFVAAGGSTTVSVSANSSWTASADVSWITLTTSSGSSSGTLSYKVAANTVTSSRSGTITVVAGDSTAHPKTVTISVTQAQAVAQTYAVTYSPGSYGTGSQQTAMKTYGEDLTLKGAIFTRSGYMQTGWATSDGGAKAYALYGTYTANAAITLYPVWTVNIAAITALDNSSLTFTTGGSANWFGQTSITHDGVDAMRSGPITHSQSTWMQTSVTGPGTISFWWYASSESTSWDYLYFSIDGVSTNIIGGTSCSWTQCSYHLPEGSHTLTWTYRKDGSVNSGEDAGFVDQVVWTDDPVAPTAPVISSVSTAYTSYAKVTWGAVSGATSYNVYRSKSATRPSSAYVSGMTTSYCYDYGATPGVMYYYWVEAVNSAGSAVSAYASGYRAISLSLGSTLQNFVAAGGSTNVSVSANSSWTASADVSWITLSTSSGSSSGTFSYTVAANTVTSSRSGTITVTAGSSTAHPKTVTLTVTQEAFANVQLPDGGPYTNVVDGIAWKFTVSDGKATLGTGSWWVNAIATSTSGAISIPSTLGGCSVVSISCGAFVSCSGLTSVTIPSSVTNIEYEAFEDCKSLTQFIVDTNNPVYQSSNGLLLSKDGKTLVVGVVGDVEIPSTVTSIGYKAFHACRELRSVSIPNSVKNIEAYAFSYCVNLSKVLIPEGVANIDSHAFWCCSDLTNVSIPSSVTNIGNCVFLNCKKLTNFIVADASQTYQMNNGLLLSKDGKTIVANISANGDIEIPSSITSVGRYAFYECGGMTSISVPPCLTSIGDSAFYECTGLVSFAIPSTVTNIGCRAFYYCTGLTNVTMTSGVTSIEKETFCGCWDLKSVTIPLGVTHIGDSAFDGCRSLESVMIPLSVTNIGRYAFSGCRFYLTSVTIPSSVTSIGSYAFAYCDDLTSVSIPSSVTSIGNSAFWGCNSLATVYVDAGDATRIRTLLSNSGFTTSGLTFIEACRVTYEPGSDGTGTQQTAIKTNGVDMVLADAIFTRSGYTQTGWAKSDGGTQAYALGAIYTANAAITLYPVWTPDVTKVADPVITTEGGTTFDTEICTVSITCATHGASIYYRDDGKTPRPTDKYLYTGPFTISNTSTIVAFAVKDGLDNSEYVTLTVTKVVKEPLTLAGVLEVPGKTVTTGGDAEWQPVESIDGAVNETAAKSGEIPPEQETWMSLTVSGMGTLTFRWRGDCEADPLGNYSYDFGAFDIDGTVKKRIDGSTEWQTVSTTIDTAGEHVFTWTYIKDDYDEDDYEGGDCIWVDQVVWTPSAAPVDPIPDIGDTPTAEEVKTALDGSADAKLATHITGAEDYNAYRAWSQTVKKPDGSAVAGQQAVKDSENAWLSFALHTDKLIETAPTNGQMKIDTFVPATDAGNFDLTVSIDGIEIGSAATEDHLKQVFGIEGSSTLDPNSFSSANVSLEFGTPTGGKVKCTAVPTDKNSGSFFMKMKMK